ncbi:CASP-like protein 4B1 [Hibiscus syriacus]|uniref:CASP-like protein n=1 Tax=Hibiscus syriacus TaxID=106335 RepID=A0A6A3B7A6_HIBSY|nr:CASP-like protein 4B1 [Hibiscus syriacus]
MSNSHDTDAASPVKAPKAPADVDTTTPGVGFGVSAITRRWQREDLLKKGYLLAIAILSALYTGVQALRHVSAKQILDQRLPAMVDFVGDQVVSYLLISSVSAAIPMTNRMREGQDNIFTDSSASAISLSFFAFVLLAISAMISGYKLSTQSYI